MIKSRRIITKEEKEQENDGRQGYQFVQDRRQHSQRQNSLKCNHLRKA